MATQEDKTSTGLVATIVVVGAFGMIAISGLVMALVRTETSRVDAVRPNHADLETVAALDRQQQESLTAPPRWLDRAKGKLAIPIDLAMGRVIDEYRAKPEAASPPPPPGMVMNPVPAAPAEGAPGGVVPAAPVPGGVVPAAPSHASTGPSGAAPAGPGSVAP